MDVDILEFRLIDGGESLSVVGGDDWYCEKFDFWKSMCDQVGRLQVDDEQSYVV